jgi:cytochrome c
MIGEATDWLETLWRKQWRLAVGFALLAPALLIGTAEVRAQDAAAGEKVFVVCKACHQVGPTAKNRTYSAANKGAHLTWDEATFTQYIKNPRGMVPGTKMIYAGLKDEQKIKDLIAYLHQFDAAPVTLIKQ